MDTDLEIYQEEKPWGNFRRFTLNTPSTVKILTVKANEEFSLQAHSKRSEFWRVISGSGVFFVDGVEKACNVGDEVLVKTGSKHRILAGDNGIEVLEISFGDFSEEDIIRYEDKYGRI